MANYKLLTGPFVGEVVEEGQLLDVGFDDLPKSLQAKIACWAKLNEKRLKAKGIYFYDDIVIAYEDSWKKQQTFLDVTMKCMSDLLSHELEYFLRDYLDFKKIAEELGCTAHQAQAFLTNTQSYGYWYVSEAQVETEVKELKAELKEYLSGKPIRVYTFAGQIAKDTGLELIGEPAYHDWHVERPVPGEPTFN